MFLCVKETFLLRTQNMFSKIVIKTYKFINRPHSLNPLCSKFNSNLQVHVLRTIGDRIFEILQYITCIGLAARKPNFEVHNSLRIRAV